MTDDAAAPDYARWLDIALRVTADETVLLAELPLAMLADAMNQVLAPSTHLVDRALAVRQRIDGVLGLAPGSTEADRAAAAAEAGPVQLDWIAELQAELQDELAPTIEIATRTAPLAAGWLRWSLAAGTMQDQPGVLIPTEWATIAPYWVTNSERGERNRFRTAVFRTDAGLVVQNDVLEGPVVNDKWIPGPSYIVPPTATLPETVVRAIGFASGQWRQLHAARPGTAPPEPLEF